MQYLALISSSHQLLVEEPTIIMDYHHYAKSNCWRYCHWERSWMNEKKKRQWLQESTLMNFHKVKSSNTISNPKEKMRLEIELFSLTWNNMKLYKYIYTLFNISWNRAWAKKDSFIHSSTSWYLLQASGFAQFSALLSKMNILNIFHLESE